MNTSNIEIVINKKKLGIVLDKNKPNPTIKTINKNGSFEEYLVNTCSCVYPGDEIIKVNEKNIEGYTFDEAMKTIKSFNERPIRLVIKPTSDKRHRRELISEKDMKTISEQATVDGLKSLSKYIKDQKNETNSSDYSSEDEEYISMSKYNDLENKHHLLKLELINSQVDNNDNKEELNKKYNPILTMDDLLCNLDIIINKYDISNRRKGISSDELIKLKCKLNEDYDEIYKECITIVKQIKLHHISKIIENHLHEKTIKKDLEIKKYNKVIILLSSFETFKNTCWLLCCCYLAYEYIFKSYYINSDESRGYEERESVRRKGDGDMLLSYGL